MKAPSIHTLPSTDYRRHLFKALAKRPYFRKHVLTLWIFYALFAFITNQLQMKKALLYTCLSFTCFCSIAQIAPNINSGNPNFPFPQFLDYGTNRASLASQNPVGVTHAEMEKHTRDAWQLMCNNIDPIAGTTVGGVQYLHPDVSNSLGYYSEADGYYLLGAAYMADKKVFDGIYMFLHDNSIPGVTRFVDGIANTVSPQYQNNGLSSFSRSSLDPKGGNLTMGSAADADADIALSLLMAYKQWGEKSGIIIPSTGKELNYKEEALAYIKTMGDTASYVNFSQRLYSSGDIGFDGYLKNGNTYADLTNWAATSIYSNLKTNFYAGGKFYFDYCAPSYYNNFRSFLQQNNLSPFAQSQFQRAEASSDWLMNKFYSQNPKHIPFVGEVAFQKDTFNFTNSTMGEDFRASWRTVLGYVWNGNPSFSWNPVTHLVEENKPNTYQWTMATRFAKFLKNPQGAPWNNNCFTAPSPSGLSFTGAATLSSYSTTGGSSFYLPSSWIYGAAASTAIAAQDFDLMATLFRQSVVDLDVHSVAKNYLDNQPKYFHDWFRLLAMLTLTGNFHAPMNLSPAANLKIYTSVDKTASPANGLVTYTFTVRNYGSVDAGRTLIKFELPPAYSLVSATKGGTLIGNAVTWGRGTLKGFKSGNMPATLDTVSLVVRLKPGAEGTICAQATVSYTNGQSWVSNQFPNQITTTMQRNCVDVLNEAAVSFTKSASKNNLVPTERTNITLSFKNSGNTQPIGGRPNVGFSAGLMSQGPYDLYLYHRLFHNADEPFINYENYRINYYLNSVPLSATHVATEGDSNGVTLATESIPSGTSSSGNWNQKLVVRLGKQTGSPNSFLDLFQGASNKAFMGANRPYRSTVKLSTVPTVADWTDDWSYSTALLTTDKTLYSPIGPDYSNSQTPIEVAKWSTDICQTPTTFSKKIMVEEWDGYVWRKVLGSTPYDSLELTNVVVVDTIPLGFSFEGFSTAATLGVTATYNAASRTVRWSAPKLKVGQAGLLEYTLQKEACTQVGQISTLAKLASDNYQALDGETLLYTCTPLGENAASLASTLRLYPVPSADLITFSGWEGKAMVTFMDALGNSIDAVTLENGASYSTMHLKNGCYMVEIALGNDTVVRRSVVILK